jgi:glucose-1-phosphate thymidylyltransferase
MKGLILAAGIGKRLRPLTQTLPKALIPIAGKPMIAYPLLKLKQADIKEIGIVIRPQHYPEFKSILKFKSLKITYIFQKKPLGTAKAIECACDFIDGRKFLLCWCDFLTPFDFRKLIQKHLRFKPIATILINKEKDPSGTAQVKFSGPYITKIVEKPKRRFSFWGSTGLMSLEPDIFDVFPKLRPSAKGEYNIADALQYLIDNGKKVRFIKLNTWRINVNTIQDLERARVKFSSAGKIKLLPGK